MLNYQIIQNQIVFKEIIMELPLTWDFNLRDPLVIFGDGKI